MTNQNLLQVPGLRDWTMGKRGNQSEEAMRAVLGVNFAFHGRSGGKHVDDVHFLNFKVKF